MPFVFPICSRLWEVMDHIASSCLVDSLPFGCSTRFCTSIGLWNVLSTWVLIFDFCLYRWWRRLSHERKQWQLWDLKGLRCFLFKSLAVKMGVHGKVYLKEKVRVFKYRGIFDLLCLWKPVEKKRTGQRMKLRFEEIRYSGQRIFSIQFRIHGFYLIANERYNGLHQFL